MDKQYYDVLEEIRKSGITNMFGAAPYLQARFPGLTESEAKEIILDWMQNY